MSGKRDGFFEERRLKTKKLTSTRKMCPKEDPPPSSCSSAVVIIASITARVHSTAPNKLVETTRARVSESESEKLRKEPESPALL